MNLKTASVIQLLGIYSDVIKELKERKVLRTGNNPVADYAEYIVTKRLNLKLLPNSSKGADAIDLTNKNKYQIKSRRIIRGKASRQLGVIRNLENNEFDYLLTIFFDETFGIVEAYKIPLETIKKYAKFSKHQNGYILIMRGDIMKDKTKKDITKIFYN